MTDSGGVAGSARDGAPVSADERLGRLYTVVAHRDGQIGHLARLKAICHAGVDVLAVTGAGVMVMAERTHQGTLYATDAVTWQLEDLQNTAAEGPCLDAYNEGGPVLEPDLGGAGGWRWPLLGAAALRAGIRALFSFPLQIDGGSIGAFDLYRDRPDPLTGEQIHDARLLAAMATRDVLALQAEAVPGSLPDMIADLSGDRAAIEQATGMVAAQLEAGIPEAAQRLRRAAIEHDHPLAEFARTIIARKRRLD